jgi:hypothetical protein
LPTGTAPECANTTCPCDKILDENGSRLYRFLERIELPWSNLENLSLHCSQNVTALFYRAV